MAESRGARARGRTDARVAALQPAPIRVGVARPGAADRESEEPREHLGAHARDRAVRARILGAAHRGYSDALFALAAMVALVLLVTCANIANLLLAARRGAGAGHRHSRLARRDDRTAGPAVPDRERHAGAARRRRRRRCSASGPAASSRAGARHVGSLPIGVHAGRARRWCLPRPCRSATALVFGLGPALRASRRDATRLLARNQRQAVGQVDDARHALARRRRSSRCRWSWCSRAMLLGRTLMNFMRIDPGFDAARLVTVVVRSRSSSGYTADDAGARPPARRAARAVPGVTSAAVSTCGLIANARRPAHFASKARATASRSAGTGSARILRRRSAFRSSRGREFTERDTAPARASPSSTSRRATLFPRTESDRQAARASGSSTPRSSASSRDARTQTLHEPPVPMVYFPIEQKPPDQQPTLTQHGRPRRPATVGGDRDGHPRGAAPDAEPKLLVDDVGPMSRRLSRDLTRERIVAYLAFGFGALTLLLAALGLYGVLVVRRRAADAGDRRPHGARRAPRRSDGARRSARARG